MSKISISTFAAWERTINIFGVYDTPLKLRVRIHNHTNSHIKITNACISIKKQILFFKTSNDILDSNQIWTIKPKQDFDVLFDISAVARDYGFNRTFSVKLFYDTTVEESDLFTVKYLHSLII